MTNVVQLHGAVMAPEGNDMEIKTFREQIVRPALKAVNMHSDASENLLIGTALVESGLNAFIQLRSGVALSPFQIEPATYIDNIRYIKRYDNKELKERILAACYMDIFPEAVVLTWDLRLATLMCRVKYWMQPEALPDSNDAEGLCRYHKKYYNSSFGKTNTNESIKHFERACK